MSEGCLAQKQRQPNKSRDLEGGDGFPTRCFPNPNRNQTKGFFFLMFWKLLFIPGGQGTRKHRFTLASRVASVLSWTLSCRGFQ